MGLERAGPLRLPMKIRIGAFEWFILTMSQDDSHRFEAVGHCVPDKLTIYILTDQPSPLVFETLLHEIAHAINWTVGIKDETHEEECVSRTIQPWLSLWRDNRELLSLLTRYCNGII
jgi:hypothetical protein